MQSEIATFIVAAVRRNRLETAHPKLSLECIAEPDYIGRKALLEDRPDDARDALAACGALNRNGLLQTNFARARLTSKRFGGCGYRKRCPGSRNGWWRAGQGKWVEFTISICATRRPLGLGWHGRPALLTLPHAKHPRGENHADLAEPLLGRRARWIGEINADTTLGHRHLSARTMPTTTFTSRPAAPSGGILGAARARVECYS